MATISDVAARAGVSRSTVSYVLNAANTTVRISDGTRQRVMEAVEELGFRRNELARAVTTGKSRMLGFWVMQSRAEPVARVLAGAMKEANDRGYFFKMLGMDEKRLDRSVIDHCQEWQLSGIIAIHPPHLALVDLYPRMREAGISLVVIDSQCPQKDTPYIASDHAEGMRQALEHLMELGHRRISCIAGRPDASDCISCERVAAYRSVMKAHGLGDHVSVDYGHWFVEEPGSSQSLCERAARKQLAGPSRPTGIVCVSDHTAMIVTRTAWEMGLRVPEDVSVTGFDNLGMAALCYPPLTTVAQSFEGMGALAVERLLNQIDAGRNSGPSVQERMPTRLVVRASTGPAPKRAE